MACSSCGHSGAVKVERSAGETAQRVRSVIHKQIINRKATIKTVVVKPANNLEKHRA
jgi:hypothetical protein